MKNSRPFFLLLAGMLIITPATFGEGLEISRVGNRSPQYSVSEGDVGFYMNYTGYTVTNLVTGEGERFFKREIGPKALEMIEAAEEVILLSVFLFDNFYAKAGAPEDIVKRLTDALVAKKVENPGMTVAVILDPSHKHYGSRVSPAERQLRENGIDVFYSDLLDNLHRAAPLGLREGAAHANRVIDRLTFNGWGNLWSGIFSRLRVPKVQFDNESVSWESVYNAFLLKANHRKLLVTDVPGGGYETMVTSGNPHNASAHHVNTALTIRGPMASYVYEVLREDIRYSIGLGRRYTHWHDGADRAYRKAYLSETLPERPVASSGDTTGPVGTTFVSEAEIPKAVIEMLDDVEAGDEVRILMFFLSYQPVLDAILEASRRVEKPIRILLDANKDSFNKEKDGTPNRQVARYLLKEGGGKIEIRWYSTHGEQNHAKAMSISNPAKKKFLFTTGSCNWTGRNMAGVNMEANAVVDGSQKINGSFDERFDLFWSNSDGNEYSLEYSVFSDAASDRKWKMGERPFYLNSF